MSTGASHVLIADDDAHLLRTAKLVLSQAGFTVGTARNGREAITYIRMHMPDVVVLDVFMPEMDGFEALREIKREFPGLRVFIISGAVSKSFDVLKLTSKLGADGVLEKPFTRQQLQDLIRNESQLPAREFKA